MTKKYLVSIIVLSSLLVLPVFACLPVGTAIAQTANLQVGSTGASVTDLQNILKTDPTIYPQGLVTGYFGTATQSAVLRLQARYGLPQTGVVDSATWQVIFPSNVQLKVISPNGGESWDKSTNHSVTWQVTVGPVMANGQQLSPSVSSSPTAVMRPTIMPFYDNVSIDLLKDSAPAFRYHLGNANLFDTQFNFQIPASVSNAGDYRVQISVGGNVPCLLEPGVGRACPMYYPQYSYSDTSDNTFTITGNGGVPNDTKAKLNALLDQMQSQINSLQNQLNSMRQLVNSL